MKHLALAVHDHERSRRFYETYLGFDAHPPRHHDGGVEIVEEWEEPEYVSVKFSIPTDT